MQFSIYTIAFFAALTAAAPRQKTSAEKAAAHTFSEPVFSKLTEADIEKRKVDAEETATLMKRNKDYVSSCGGGDSGLWMPVRDITTSTNVFDGYKDAVESWCYHATHSSDGSTTTISKGNKYSFTVSDGYYSTDGTPVHVDIEVHNKELSSYTLNEGNCKTYLMMMTKANGNGKVNGDTCFKTGTAEGQKNTLITHGGSYQLADSEVSFHAFIKTGSS
ncbi:hypothetical protein K490DRAFT_60923 [Saccharata proteae CBS 121410]|uniref:Uncharacterized protein n=1 Tax=Saccharata proteae CBS 121410 TaxID=1314787 RepID=A0A9P4LZJ6_9PEZI|nr:hypothetical protein K490DRAFT_60923 [Saccharata proteae CBS 121410]